MKREISIAVTATLIGALLSWFVIKSSGLLEKDISDTQVNEVAKKLANEHREVLIASLKSFAPKGAVVAFASLKCPGGWSEYPEAYGRFIRGIDKSGNSIDPDGVRGVGQFQSDMIQTHIHRVNGMQVGGGAPNNGGFRTDITGGPFTQKHGTGVPEGARAGPETRPKNVALLYCIKD